MLVNGSQKPLLDFWRRSVKQGKENQNSSVGPDFGFFVTLPQKNSTSGPTFFVSTFQRVFGSVSESRGVAGLRGG